MVEFVTELKNYLNRIEKKVGKIRQIVSCNYSGKEKPWKKNIFADKTVEDESAVTISGQDFYQAATF